MTLRTHRRRTPFLWLGLLLFLSSSCSPEPYPADASMMESWKSDLMAADRAFNDATARDGATGWASFFAEQGAMISEGVGEIRGRESILSRMEGAFGNPAFRLSWDPFRAEVSKSGDLGYTVGRYESTLGSGDDRVVMARGLYVSIWRRQADGSWKVEMDLGNPTEEFTPEGGSEEGG